MFLSAHGVGMPGHPTINARNIYSALIGWACLRILLEEPRSPQLAAGDVDHQTFQKPLWLIGLPIYTHMGAHGVGPLSR